MIYCANDCGVRQRSINTVMKSHVYHSERLRRDDAVCLRTWPTFVDFPLIVSITVKKCYPVNNAAATVVSGDNTGIG